MKKKLIGPFSQLLTLRSLPMYGALSDQQLEVITDGALVIEDGRITDMGKHAELLNRYAAEHILMSEPSVCTPAYVDCHTHIAFAGNRANDFALRNSGASYLEIAEAGGGIWSTVLHTRSASLEELVANICLRAQSLMQQGVTTIEVKSGYGLSVEQEIKILRAIRIANQHVAVDLVPTCLAAHMKPHDFTGSASAYLSEIATKLFPILRDEHLARRIDIFIEKSAFSVAEAEPYLLEAKRQGFDITVHADQFTAGGSRLAIQVGAVSADHLEASTAREAALFAQSKTVAVALPGASMGLGSPYTDARDLLDQDACLAIATDWNPGSAPMGQLMVQASVFAAAQKLSNAELFAAITYRAAKAVSLSDRGILDIGMLADFCTYSTENYQNITYLQGTLQPQQVWKNGKCIYQKGERL
ncbi:imidazolonepropionase [Sphingobacterium suaedae]|uniref:Imidazolonepropionase n=1 Tax=Sphingobacterium suaedae TaxID=1686402 RepID=A0ABW5KJ73_9SPHI